MIEDEVTECLRELIDLVGATSARIGAEVSDGVERSDIPPRIGGDANGVGRLDIPARIIPLGAGEYLRLELRARKPNVDVDAALEHAMRTLRTIRRRWEVARLPEVTVSADRTRGPTALERIQEYVGALAVIDRASNAFLVHRSDLIVAARPADEFEAMRWPLLARRIMSIHSPHSSHGELVEPDAFAMSFWYEAALVVLLAEPYAVDFVRHRCRQVARELCHLLPLLDPDPDAPAAIGPRSPTQGDG